MNNKIFYKKMFAFLISTCTERVVFSFAALLSTFIVSQIGSKEVAGVSIAITIINIVQALFFALGVGVTVSIAKSESEKQAEIVSTGFVMTFVFSLIITLLFLLFGDALILLLFKKSEEAVRNIAIYYLEICSFGFVFLAFETIISACFRGIMDVKIPANITLFSNALNVAFSLLFSFVFDYGYKGCAFAYLISIVFSFVCKALYIAIKKNTFCIKKICLFNKACCFEILKISFPSIVEQFFIKSGFLGMQAITALLGTAVLSGYQIANNILNVIYSVTAGFESTQMTFVSYYSSKGMKRESRMSVWNILWVGEALILVFGVLLFAFSEKIAEFFMDTHETVNAARDIIRLLCITLPFTTCFQILQGSLKSCRDIIFVAGSNVLHTWLLRILLAFVLVFFFDMGFYGLFIAFMVDYVMRAATFAVTCKKEHWLI